MFQQTNRLIVLVMLLMIAFHQVNTQQFVLGQNIDYTFSMSYLEREAGEAIRVQYVVKQPEILLPGRAHMAICCTTLPPTPGEEDETPIDAPNPGRPAAAAPAPATPAPAPAKVEPTKTTPTEEPSANQPALSTSSVTIGVATPSNGNRNLATELGKCFAIKFDCYLKVACKTSLDAAVTLYSSSLKEGTNIYAAGGSDLYLGNVGSIALGTSKDYNSIYRFNEKDAGATNIPLVGENTHMTCYSAYNITSPNSVLFDEHDLSDRDKFTVKKHVLFGVLDQAMKEAGKKSPGSSGKESSDGVQESSGVFLNVLQLSFMSVLLAIFTIF